MTPLGTRKTRQAKRLHQPDFARRRRALFIIMGLVTLALVGQTSARQVFQTEFLQKEGARRYLRSIEIPADRGMILDRNGERLAVSIPVDTIWADPRELLLEGEKDEALKAKRAEELKTALPQLAKALEMKPKEVLELLERNKERGFLYLKRRVGPEVAEAVRALGLPGIQLDKEYRRFYPAAEVVAHVLGFTDVEDRGQEGLELAFNGDLVGQPGKKRILRDGKRRIVQDLEEVRPAQPGKRLQLSLDLRLQYLSYRALKSAVEEHKAIGGAAVLLDAKTGEILAMVNQPGYNPNGNRARDGGRLRNRSVTDLFEPGSTVKPFIAAAALESGRYRPNTPINTSPGFMRVGAGTVRDVHNYGPQDVTGVIRKSSNVGVAKMALDLGPQKVWDIYDRIGLGQPLGTGFPGEGSGKLSDPKRWKLFDQAVHAFGYGITVNALQLARAYSVLANDGRLVQPSFFKQSDPAFKEVLSPQVARQIRAMLEEVVSVQGTAQQAAVPGYRVGGKTGTAKKVIDGRYADKAYQSVFAGMAPMSDPRLVMVVMVDEPRGGKYYGGLVAAPVFSQVMTVALRLMQIPPDQSGPEQLQLVKK